MTYRRRDGWESIPEAIFAAAMNSAKAGRKWGGANWRFDFDSEREDDDRRGPGRHGPARRKRKMMDSAELRLVMLKLISDQPRHGYDLIKAIEEMTEGGYTPSAGLIYPTLSLLEDSGLIAPEDSEGSRKVYTITPEGAEELTERRDDVEALFDRLDAHGEKRRERETGGAPIGRAIGNLMAALGNRVAKSGIDSDTRHKVAEILDEAAQKIERL